MNRRTEGFLQRKRGKRGKLGKKLKERKAPAKIIEGEENERRGCAPAYFYVHMHLGKTLKDPGVIRANKIGRRDCVSVKILTEGTSNKEVTSGGLNKSVQKGNSYTTDNWPKGEDKYR